MKASHKASHLDNIFSFRQLTKRRILERQKNNPLLVCFLLVCFWPKIFENLFVEFFQDTSWYQLPQEVTMVERLYYRLQKVSIIGANLQLEKPRDRFYLFWIDKKRSFLDTCRYTLLSGVCIIFTSSLYWSFTNCETRWFQKFYNKDLFGDK